MRKHELDLTSLVAGLVFVAIAVVYLVAAGTNVHVDAGWVLPFGLVGLGVAGLAGSLRVGLRRDAESQPDGATELTATPPEDPS
jgi:hypothetical protein